ncbi:rust resistance kinase Lr10-like [Mercurialis annua]|uniref:rust resistance kinase Lr10-like n=1 Tax=Mercurialis annua TaxID=3986 RepID=UPI00215E7409|nr:rust resistance kinase Lr10-like [Mercurialis annua]
MLSVVSASYAILTIVLLFSATCCRSKPTKNKYLCSTPLSCGIIKNISYPFGLEGGPENCGDPNYLLACENNNTILHLDSGKLLVKEINHYSQTIRVVDAGLLTKNCSSLPLYSLQYFFSDHYSRFTQESVVFLSCKNPVSSSRYVERAPCVSGVYSSKKFSSTSSEENLYSYVMFGPNLKISEIQDMCRVDFVTTVSSIKCEMSNCSYLDIYKAMINGFELSWPYIYCKECIRQGACKFNDDYSKILGCSSNAYISNLTITLLGISGFLYHLSLAAVSRCFLGAPFFLCFLVYKWRRRHLSMYDKVEDFLRSNNNLMPIMYSYGEIKKMTRGFKDKLGEGGYGSVYKGKLSSGRAVAIKLLSKPKGNGQDFINEIATIGRIHHVNVVQLIGFCAERSKRALVYDFMPNGSLEKYIFSQNEGEDPLSCEKMYKICLGIARGIEYLHRGCDMQILHFDIKPHNILLDENFGSKVSDFGLAKLYPTEDSIVSLTAPRGTMGYMAPELFYKNIGGISYKADVYSFGMLLMEMAGRRKNLNAFAEHSSQIYLPTWAYEQFNKGKDIEIENAGEEERKLTKKMMIVALWCIQMKPDNRPSMNRVVEMLEGEVESLQMPPKPFLSPQ